MAYYNGNVGKGEWDKVICDPCADKGAIPFETDKDGTRWQLKPWRWAPWLAGNLPCDKCGKIIP